MDQLEQAIKIAVKAHKGQKDKSGMPYILHPVRVMLNLRIEDIANDRKFKKRQQRLMICGILHDVIEDSPITLSDLRLKGIKEPILKALDCLSKREGEIYDDYISRVIKNPMACIVKLADLEDNMNLNRIESMTQKDFARIEKYEKAKARIIEKLHQL